MVILLIRRFVRADKEKEFLATYDAQKPTGNPAFKGETLTRVSDAADLPAGLRGLALNGPTCITYLNIATWDSWEAFAQQFDVSGSSFDADTETAPRQRIVLDVVRDKISN
jgi:hypothetical protein